VVAAEAADAACNACGDVDAVRLLQVTDHPGGETFDVVRCRQCRLCYVRPCLRLDQITPYYPATYYGNRHPFLVRLMMALRGRKLPRAAKAGRLLDFGCGRGDFLLHCRRQGWTVAGVELTQSPIVRMKRALGIEVYEPDCLEQIPATHFDVVTLWHALEHMPDPAGTLGLVRRILKPGGLVLIEVPNFGSWQARLGGPAWFHLDVPRHLFHFDKVALMGLLQRQGFQPRRWETFSLEYDAFGLAQTALNRICTRPNHLFQVLIQGGDAAKAHPGDTVSSLLLGPLLVALALPASALAAMVGAGGVLRVWAEKADS
jgi:2-polyprenyl-3-methyl-5-hydroxy-6-metoxy-1,4-benzoquinol methylase